MNLWHTLTTALLLSCSLAAHAAPGWHETDVSAPLQEVLHELEAQLAIDLGLEDVAVQPVAKALKVQLPPGDVHLQLLPGHRPASTAFRTRLQPWIEVRVDGVLRRTVAVPVQVSARRRVLQATRAIAVGEALSPNNTQAVLQDATGCAEALAAQELRPSHRTTALLAPGSVVPRQSVRDGARAVRGTVVPVTFRLAAVEVQAPGTLLDNETQEGQAVRVRMPRMTAPVRAYRVQGQFIAIEDKRTP